MKFEIAQRDWASFLGGAKGTILALFFSGFTSGRWRDPRDSAGGSRVAKQAAGQCVRTGCRSN